MIPSHLPDHNHPDEKDGSEEDVLQLENYREKRRIYKSLRRHKPNKLGNTCKPLVNGEKLLIDKT
jgi:hypothetical protein